MTDDDVTRFRDDGYLVIDRFVEDDVVAQLRAAYDEVLAGSPEAGEQDRMLGDVTRQVMSVHRFNAVFADNPAYRMAMEVARRIFHTRHVARGFDMLIYKPPGHPYDTPWHQDWSYSQSPFAAAGSPIAGEGIQFWIALDDADVENGCMHFVPGRHREPLLPHRVASGDPDSDHRLLELVDPKRDLDLDTAVAAVVPAGGATLHGRGTPHYTPANRSASRPRRAYIVNISPVDA